MVFLQRYENEKYAAAAKELGKNVAGIKRRVKELDLGKK